MRVRPRYTPEFRADAVEALRRSDRSIPQVAEDLGVSSFSLRQWYKRDEMAKKKNSKDRTAQPVGKAVLTAGVGEEGAKDRLARLERENAALRKENDSLKMDREILKKAAAFFVKESE